MRAAVLFGLVLLVGTFVGGVWWWTHETRNERLPEGVARRTVAEAVPSTPIGSESSDSSEPRRTSVREPEDAKRDGSEAPPSNSLLVHVVDAETRAELVDVSVFWSGSSFTPDSPTDPLDPQYVVEHAPSPVSILQPGSSPSSVTRTKYGFTFCARGYVRTLVTLDFVDRSERTVELAPAGSLIVEVRGELPKMPESRDVKGVSHAPYRAVVSSVSDREPKLRLRQRRPGIVASDAVGTEFGIDIAQKAVQIGETRFDEVMPGEWVVSVEYGTPGRSPRVLAMKHVRVVAREVARVVLEIERIAAPILAPLAGTLRLPPGVSIELYSLEIQPRDQPGAIESDWRTLDAKSMEPVAGRSDTWRWDAGEVLSGTHSITIRGTSITKIVDVPPAGATDVALEVPTHAMLRVRVVSANDGSPVKLTWLDWTPEREEGVATRVSPILLLHDEATHTFTSSVPLGRGRLESFGADLWALDDAVEAEIFPGEQELVARVHPIGGAIVTLTTEEKNFEMSRRLVDAVAIAPVGGSGRCIWRRLTGGSLSFAVDPPGRYTVTLPAIAGYEPVAPFEVDVDVGTFVKVPVEMRRE